MELGIAIINIQYFTQPIPRGKAYYICKTNTTVISFPSGNFIDCYRKSSKNGEKKSILRVCELEHGPLVR